MELNKYKNDGWGISVIGFGKLLDLITENKENELRILEFGSGISTSFFCDVVKDGIKKLNITSFDNDLNYSYKPNESDTFLDLKIRGLIECNDEDYNKQFSSKHYQSDLMYDKVSPLHPCQKNNFYKIEDGDLNGKYDIVLLDGPNGNGRNFCFLHIQKHVKKGSLIYIDDYNHYDFVEKALEILNGDIIHKYDGDNDNFVIIKIK